MNTVPALARAIAAAVSVESEFPSVVLAYHSALIGPWIATCGTLTSGGSADPYLALYVLAGLVLQAAHAEGRDTPELHALAALTADPPSVVAQQIAQFNAVDGGAP